MEKSQRKITKWRISIIIVIILTALGLSPVVIPAGVYKPGFMGMPYTLWMGILVCVFLVLMTYIGSRIHPGNTKKYEKL